MAMNEYNSDNIFIILWNKRKTIIIASLSSVIIFSIISLLLENVYTSTCIISPPKSNTIFYMGFNVANNNTSVSTFGDEDHTEQMMEVLNSSELRDIIVNKYNLYNHYSIDANEKESLDKLITAYSSSIALSKSKFNAVKISVSDRSPDTAAFIANDISSYYDTLVNKMIKERAIVAYNNVSNYRNQTQKEIQILIDSAKSLSGQTKKFDSNYTDARNVASNDLYSITLFNKISEEIKSKTEILHSLEASMIQYESDINQNIPQKFLIQKAIPNDKKTSPIRWLIVVLGTLGTLMFSSIVILFTDRFKKIPLHK